MYKNANVVNFVYVENSDELATFSFRLVMDTIPAATNQRTVDRQTDRQTDRQM